MRNLTPCGRDAVINKSIHDIGILQKWRKMLSRHHKTKVSQSNKKRSQDCFHHISDSQKFQTMEVFFLIKKGIWKTNHFDTKGEISDKHYKV